MPGFTVEEAAKKLGYKEGTVRVYIRRHKIKMRKFGRDVRILREDNEAIFLEREALQEQEVVPA